MIKPVMKIVGGVAGLFVFSLSTQASVVQDANATYLQQSNQFSAIELTSLTQVVANTRSKKKIYSGQRTVVFSPRSLKWYAYDENGRLVKSGRASGGASYCADVGRSCRTPVGTYTVFSKGGPGCASSRYPKPNGGAKMPYCMFFHKAGYGIHGSYDLPARNASHGCIRVHPSAAKWLNQNFVRNGTRVVVQSY